MAKTIGFIGLGTMGSRMAARLLDAGHTVTVFNRDAAKTKPLASKGAAVADTVPDLVRGVDYICISVSNDAAIQDVVRLALQADCAGKTFISLSTISPDTAEELANSIADQQAHFIDAPVSGSAPQVESGQLVIFTGGDEANFKAAQPIFEAISKAVYYLGPAGNGSRMKLVANTLLGIGAQALAEALLLGQRMGLHKEEMIGAMSEIAAVSPSQKIKLQNALTSDYSVAFSLANMYKDFGLILEQAHKTYTPMPATMAAQNVSAIAMARNGDVDFAVVIRELEKITEPPGDRRQ